ncbi:Microtubule-actin cross-linking factor 1, isoforms 1/2/3/5 [Rhizoctonia solani]|uniref:Microtubule-actin cross-linking factor 1, isoforms 1/2/3/5 n=1 Tax=Rhizoctonia solani TaxID=456999 RepID=A0A0K6FM00_9AGAM|nr:Microtubule-actin cross-linking factor 1, isoforms 1/2/3/5 [Rhizoctonia solani]
MAQRLSDTSTHSGSAGRAISRSMTADEILPLLSDHGCEDITDQLSQVGPLICKGGFGDVHQGALRNGDQVAVKCLRMLGIHDNDEKQLKFAAHELYVWSKCRHRNVLKLLGVAIYNNQIAMVSPWMANGDLPRYLSRYPEADRYDLCSQVADAVAYLKDKNMVHGDIKGHSSHHPYKANILISKDHVPKLTDFGTSALSKYTLAFTRGSGSQLGMSLRWTAPEIFVEGKANTFESDVYALGMEAFTGSVPYAKLHDRAVMGRLMQKVPPEIPEECIGGKYGDALWIIMNSSWDAVPENRPTAQWVRNILMVIMEATKTDNEFKLAMSAFHNRPRAKVPLREPTYFTGASTEDLDTHAGIVVLKEDLRLTRDYFDRTYVVFNELDHIDRLGKTNSVLRMVGSRDGSSVRRGAGWEWNQIRTEFDYLLRESREVAATVAGGSRDNPDPTPGKTHVHDTTASFAEKKLTLENIIQDIEKIEACAEKMAQGYTDILGNIRKFQRSLVIAQYPSKLKNSRGEIEDRIQYLSNKIEGLTKSITESKVQLELLLDQLPDKDDVVGNRILMAIRESLGGDQGTFGHIKTIGARRVQANLAWAKRELDERAVEVASLESGVLNLEHLMALPTEVAESSTEFIYGRLEAFAKLWDGVHNNAQAIIQQLSKAQKSSEQEVRLL